MWFKHLERFILGSFVVGAVYLIFDWIMEDIQGKIFGLLLFVTAYYLGYVIDYYLINKNNKKKPN